jgi:SAM-dependent methyltransferase
MNRAAYDAIAARWDASRRIFAGDERRYLDTMLAAAPAGSTILDLGCGTGRPLADYVIERGYEYIGVDQSAGMLAIAQARLPDAQWILAPIEAVAIDRPVAGIICWDALFHLERALHEPLLRRCAEWLLPHGRIMLTSGGSAQAPFHDTMFDVSFFYDSWPPERLRSLMLELGFEPVVFEWTHQPDGGRERGRIALIASVGSKQRRVLIMPGATPPVHG